MADSLIYSKKRPFEDRRIESLEVFQEKLGLNLMRPFHERAFRYGERLSF